MIAVVSCRTLRAAGSIRNSSLWHAMLTLAMIVRPSGDQAACSIV